MYNIFKKLAGLFFIVLQCSFAFGQRNVFWVHGFSDDDKGWGAMDSLYTGFAATPGKNPAQTGLRQLNTVSRESYETKIGLQYFINDFSDPSKNPVAKFSQPDDIAICHSMGGIMMRNYDRNNQGQIGGIITVGSPLKGMRFANAIKTGQVQAFIDDAIHQVSKGPEALVDQISLIFAQFSGPDPTTTIGQISKPISKGFYIVGNVFTFADLTGILGKIATSFAFSSLNLSPNSQSITDLQEGSVSAIGSTDQNAYPTSTHKLSIYGNESEPALWNLLGTALGKDAIEGVKLRDKIADIYQTIGFTEILVGIAEDIGGFWNPWWWFQSIFAYLTAYQFYDGRDWLINTSNRAWNSLIGSDRVESYSYPRTFMGNPSDFFGCYYKYPNDFVARTNCQKPFTTTVYQTVYSSANLVSDGVIAGPSATAFNTTSWSNAEQQVEARNINHKEEQGTNATMQTVWNSIFDKDPSLTYFHVN